MNPLDTSRFPTDTGCQFDDRTQSTDCKSPDPSTSDSGSGARSHEMAIRRERSTGVTRFSSLHSSASFSPGAFFAAALQAVRYAYASEDSRYADAVTRPCHRQSAVKDATIDHLQTAVHGHPVISRPR